jgi:hypothetical protein
MPNAKRSWPLLLLTACSLIPGFGLVFGAAGVSWGLVSDRPRARLMAPEPMDNLELPMMCIQRHE